MPPSCPARHKASGCESREGVILLIKFTFHPQLPDADRETEASKQELPKVTPRPPRIPRKPSPRAPGSRGCPAKRASGSGPAFGLTGRKRQGRAGQTE